MVRFANNIFKFNDFPEDIKSELKRQKLELHKTMKIKKPYEHMLYVNNEGTRYIEVIKVEKERSWSWCIKYGKIKLNARKVEDGWEYDWVKGNALPYDDNGRKIREKIGDPQSLHKYIFDLGFYDTF